MLKRNTKKRKRIIPFTLLVVLVLIPLFYLLFVKLHKPFSWDEKISIEKCGSLPLEIFDHPGLDRFTAIEEKCWLPNCRHVIYSVSVSGTSSPNWTDEEVAELQKAYVEKSEKVGGVWLLDPKSLERKQIMSGAEISGWVSKNKVLLKKDNEVYIYNTDVNTLTKDSGN